MINQLPNWIIQMMRKNILRHLLFAIFTKTVILEENGEIEFKCFASENSFKNGIMVDLNEKHIWTWKKSPPKQGFNKF